MIELIIATTIGLFIGALISNICHCVFAGSGKLQIFHGEDKDSYNFKVDKLDDLNKKRRFILKVEHLPR